MVVSEGNQEEHNRCGGCPKTDSPVFPKGKPNNGYLKVYPGGQPINNVLITIVSWGCYLQAT